MLALDPWNVRLEGAFAREPLSNSTTLVKKDARVEYSPREAKPLIHKQVV
jgi:hypothetical protein